MKKIDYYQSVGRRRTAVARVRVFRGKGESTINSQVIEKYFPGEVSQKAIAKAFGATDSSDKHYFTAKVRGGGKEGQLDAVVLGIARSLVKVSPEKNRPVLRKLKLLTRDSRVRQRRMVGMGGKSRRKKQSPKR